jgi:uroporphyrin-III C-methyltransferase/precorrin-2 dehydrogenase/sirohydrochlorin ferrochelatase
VAARSWKCWQRRASLLGGARHHAAAGATAYAGIPLTHRDHAQSAVFITGHCQIEGKEPDWQQLAATSQTLVIYMGLMRSEHIQQQLVSHGRAPALPSPSSSAAPPPASGC